MGVIIPAAGKGKRMGASLNKQYLELKGRPLLTFSLETFLKLKVGYIVIVVAKGEIEICKDKVLTLFPTSQVVVEEGGKERQNSVYNGLKALPKNIRYVCVHDGARPLVTPSIINKVYIACQAEGSAAAAIPLKDTIKEVDGSGFVLRTPAREKYMAVQTPQIFRKDIILTSYEKSFRDGFQATDDTSLAEKYGYKVKLVQGSYENIKITTPEDLYFAESILEKRDKGR